MQQPGEQFKGVPLHPQRHRAMPRNWSLEPEHRMISNLSYRTSRYGAEPPPTSMVSNLRQQQTFRRTAWE
jgi:hypothetical protein